MSDQPINAVKARIRNDIRAAMSAKNMSEAKVLRTVLAALDNAEAVPVARGHTPYIERLFGDPAVEVERKTLSQADIDAIIAAERQERLTAAQELETHGRTAEAAALKGEAALVARYTLVPPAEG